MKKKTILPVIIFTLVSGCFCLNAQKLASPFDFPLQLAGGFCELRTNHFHAGLDIRTQGTEGHAVHAVANGYISRVSVSPGGYGNAIYITHSELKLVTIYGHLQRFNTELAKMVKKKQYEKESFSIDLDLDSALFPVKQGEIIGYSGNSGSSGGPHLHLEVRDLKTNEMLDPLNYYQSMIPDTLKPVLKGIMIYPVEDKGVVNGSAKKQKIEIQFDAKGNPVVKTPIEVWGKIGLGIRATDRMNGTNFSYGLKSIIVEEDNTEIFKSLSDRFSIEESKYINSYTDYEEWSVNRTFFIKTFIDPGNKLRFISGRNSGIINIDEERIYNITFTLKDIYGNTSKIPLQIEGKKQEIPKFDDSGSILFKWNKGNKLETNKFRIKIPINGLYANVHVKENSYKNEKFYSPVYQITTMPVSLKKSAEISILADSLTKNFNPNQLGIVSVKNNNYSWIGGTCKDGWMVAKISTLGGFSIARDTIKPVITPLNSAKWRVNKQIRFKISDNLSGISSFRGEIDGKYALFEYDSKNAILKYIFDNERLLPGQHRLTLVVSDQCGNNTIYKNTFTR
jgi:murein DD-endopeptidase MepM/ murein hydrolase activator NlpD